MKAFWIAVVIGLLPAAAAAQWYPPLMIESHAAYSCGYTYLFDITVGRAVSVSGSVDEYGNVSYGPLCWGDPGAYYDVIRITVWPDEDTRDSGGWRKVVIQTRCEGTSILRYLEQRTADGMVHQYTVAEHDEAVVQIGNEGRHVLVTTPAGTLYGFDYVDGDIVYTVETLDVHNMGNWKDIVVSDSAGGVSEQDPRCVKIQVPIEENTWGAVKAIYQ